MAIASFAIALLLPGVRAEHSLLPGQVRRGLIMIKDADCNDDSSPTISPRQYRTWKGRKQQYFDGLSFYRVTRETVAAESHGSTQWEVGRASSNLFSLLGLTVQFAKADVKADDNTPRVILSEEAWKRRFNADSHIAGSIVRVGQHSARIMGVVPDGSSGLPGKVDVWLLEPDSMIASDYKGYVVARLTALGKSAMWASRFGITDRKSDHSEDDLLGFSLEEGIPGSKTVFLFAVFLAFLALPAMTSVSLGEYSVSSQRSSLFRSLYRPGFLCVKIALLLPIAYFVSLDMAYGYARIESTQSVYIQLAVSFTICLLGMRWVLQDQRQRCPVCLRRVAHPAQVGLASRTFLAWNGTEMMCMGGHTLLHIPSLPTSWFSTQRWLYLDTSWEFLFAIKMYRAEICKPTRQAALIWRKSLSYSASEPQLGSFSQVARSLTANAPAPGHPVEVNASDRCHDTCRHFRSERLSMNAFAILSAYRTSRPRIALVTSMPCTSRL
jgi:hypothetical protein